jgi:LPXTG-motif cell wall-anchored protein
VKPLLFLACLLLVGSSQIARAEEHEDDGGSDDKPGISATEMGALGASAAALIGVGGYLALRRRKSA